MIDNENRIKNFTSSQMFRVMGTPAVVKTYIRKKEAERALNRSIDLGGNAKPMTWGKIMEAFFFSQEKYFPTGCGYSLCNKKTVLHPKYSYWAGSPDLEGKEDVGEIKCFEPDNYYQLAKDLINVKTGKTTLEEFKKDNKEVYWQVVSNGVILGKPKCTIFAYIPTLEELEDCILLIEETGFCETIGLDPNAYKYIVDAKLFDKMSTLPYLDTSKTDFPNMVSYTFTTPVEDIIALTKAVIAAEKELNNG